MAGVRGGSLLGAVRAGGGPADRVLRASGGRPGGGRGSRLLSAAGQALRPGALRGGRVSYGLGPREEGTPAGISF